MPSPADIVKSWVAHFNRADADALAALYAKDCINHQIPTGIFEGRETIRRMFQDEFAQYEMTCIPENLFEDGEWAILEWKDPKGLQGCGFFHVQNAQIVFQRGYWDKATFISQQQRQE